MNWTLGKVSRNDPTGACRQSSVQINNKQGSFKFCEGADISKPQATTIANVIPTGSKMEVLSDSHMLEGLQNHSSARRSLLYKD